MPLLVLAAGAFAQSRAEKQAAAPLVGLWAPEGEQRAASVVRALTAREGGFRFEQAESLAALQTKTAAGVYTCGYAFAEGFDERAARRDWHALLTCYAAPGAALRPVVDESVTAAVLEECWPDIAAGALAGLGIEGGALPATDAGQAVSPMAVQVYTVSGRGGEELTAASGGTDAAALLPGLCAILLFVLVLLGVAGFARDARAGFWGRLRPLAGAAGAFAPYLGAVLLAGFLSGGAALLLAGALFPGAGIAPLQTLGGWLLYTLYLFGLGMLLCGLLGRRALPVAALPFVVLACLLLCPLLWDAGGWAPGLAWAGWVLPPTLLLRGLGGNAAALLAMPLLGLLFGALGCLAIYYSNKNRILTD